MNATSLHDAPTLARGGPRPQRVALALVAALLCAGLGQAHLAFPEFYSVKATVTADGEELHVEALVEIPLAELVLAFNRHFQHIDLIAEIQAGKIEALEDEFREAMFERLGAGLGLEVDGQRHDAWRPADSPINGRAGEGFFVYILETTRALAPSRELRVQLTNALYPDQQMVLANLAFGGDGWAVDQASTPQPPPGADLEEGSEDELLLWSDDPEKRQFQVSFRGSD